MKFGYMLAGTEGIVTTADYEASNKITGFESLADENLAMLEVSDAYSAFESVAFASDVEVECGMEADTTPDKNLKWYQKVWEWIKNIFKSLWGYIKTAYNWLKKKIFGDKSAVAQEKKVVEETAEVVEEAYQEVVKQGLLTMKEKAPVNAGGGNTTPPPSSGPTSTRTEQTTPTSPASNVIVPEYKGPTVTAEPSVIIPEYKGEPVPEPVVEVVQKIVAKKQNLLALPAELRRSFEVALSYKLSTAILEKGNTEFSCAFFKFPDNIINRLNNTDISKIFYVGQSNGDDTVILEAALKNLTDGYAALLNILFGDKYGYISNTKADGRTGYTVEEVLKNQQELHKQTDFLLKKNKTFAFEKIIYPIKVTNGKVERSSVQAIYRDLEASLKFSNQVALLLDAMEKYMSNINAKVQEYDAYKSGSNTHLNGKEIDEEATKSMKNIRIALVKMGQLSKAVVKCIGVNNMENIYKNVQQFRGLANNMQNEEVA